MPGTFGWRAPASCEMQLHLAEVLAVYSGPKYHKYITMNNKGCCFLASDHGRRRTATKKQCSSAHATDACGLSERWPIVASLLSQQGIVRYMWPHTQELTTLNISLNKRCVTAIRDAYQVGNSGLLRPTQVVLLYSRS